MRSRDFRKRAGNQWEPFLKRSIFDLEGNRSVPFYKVQAEADGSEFRCIVVDGIVRSTAVCCALHDTQCGSMFAEREKIDG
jgi:hypothetical protein